MNYVARFLIGIVMALALNRSCFSAVNSLTLLLLKCLSQLLSGRHRWSEISERLLQKRHNMQRVGNQGAAAIDSLI